MRLSVITTAVLLGGLAVSSAQAMPTAVAPAHVEKNAAVINVDYACGRGWHVTPWGECRPNGWRRPPPRYWDDRRPARYGWHEGGYRHHDRDRWDRPRW